ncbi:hypothetical protein FJ930_13350 [Mesorhizobium sp. B2-4-15]|uniref:hypothetical protein n=1 Tax=Mesorhizobium sp. B2-4-15 TaxID=2589934 RepID=UPI00114DFE6D|nr:hypothetical protein [Mesorhizobium sp. B2-4-15]TPK72143.1 hypothetical protein FJ930_13350 [Mesorhizobium sp. B2-4-15]
MARSITRHRRLLDAIEMFSRKTGSGRWTVRSTPVRLCLVLSNLLEASARRRLIRLQAGNRLEAEQKVRYLIATMLARKVKLQPSEVDTVKASVGEFHPDIAGFLRKQSG